MGKAVIFANGEIRDISFVKNYIQPENYLVAANGGWENAKRVGLRPHLIIGDFDSIRENESSIIRKTNIQIVRFPRDKDQTDLELALLEIMGRGYRDILIIGGLGGRLDQTLANLALLIHPSLVGCQIYMDDGKEEVCLVKNTITIQGQIGDRISLLAFGSDAEGITTEGLKYPLNNETLYPYQTRGVSNVMVSNTARINLTRGTLLCIHTRMKKNYKKNG